MQVSPFENCGAVVSDFQLATMTDAELVELRAAFTPAVCQSLWQYCGEQVF